jgi:hypothetical protein
MNYSTSEQHMVKKNLSMKVSVTCLNKFYFISSLLCTNLNEFKLKCSTDDEICTQVHSYHIQVAYQKLHEIKLTCKRHLEDSLLIEFKIELKILSFQLNFSNKSCRARL